ncbi:hypothetical protein V8C26DRAFT_325411 [Trichoderma gracile]
MESHSGSSSIANASPYYSYSRPSPASFNRRGSTCRRRSPVAGAKIPHTTNWFTTLHITQDGTKARLHILPIHPQPHFKAHALMLSCSKNFHFFSSFLFFLCACSHYLICTGRAEWRNVNSRLTTRMHHHAHLLPPPSTDQHQAANSTLSRIPSLRKRSNPKVEKGGLEKKKKIEERNRTSGCFVHLLSTSAPCYPQDAFFFSSSKGATVHSQESLFFPGSQGWPNPPFNSLQPLQYYIHRNVGAPDRLGAAQLLDTCRRAPFRWKPRKASRSAEAEKLKNKG